MNWKSQKQCSFWKLIRLGRGGTFLCFFQTLQWTFSFLSLIFRSNSHHIRERNWYILTVGGHSAGEGCISETWGSLLNWIFGSQCFQVWILIFNYQYDNMSLNHSQNRIWKLKCHWGVFHFWVEQIKNLKKSFVRNEQMFKCRCCITY